MRRVTVFLLASLLLPRLVDANQLEANWDWMVSLEHQKLKSSLYFPDSQNENEKSINALLDVELRYLEWLGVLALKGNNLYSSQPDNDSEAELVVKELFWQGTASFLDVDLDITLGKVRVDWGVGYGYRPLDIIKPYRRNPIGIQVEEGAGVVSVSYFDYCFDDCWWNTGEWTLIYADSSWVSQQGSELEQSSEQQGIGIRRYWLAGDSEWQGIGYYDDVRRGLLGGSWVTVLDEAWELHASAIYQNKYESFTIPDSLLEPVQRDKQSDGAQGLVGLTWAHESGQSVVLEYWYDSRSWSKTEWEQAYLRVTQLKAESMADGLRYSHAQGYQAANLVSHNVMFHWTLDRSAWQQWSWSQNMAWLHELTPTLDVLYSPQDNGMIATQWLNYSAVDTGAVQFDVEIAARFVTGDKQSAYRSLADNCMILLNLKGRF
ncbi:hypothetical protein MD588_15600 [Photobacterium sp. SDRW27]|uniref:hypothetical protein n=1 Tax=Photobacterium obscurum TaxID=2829490 RepID=UPI0022443475|nr:hypothetical protein [Photobacterium obscurum]MCW8330235.1 hypothetical protein [Photobacterium obscurum]